MQRRAWWTIYIARGIAELDRTWQLNTNIHTLQYIQVVYCQLPIKSYLATIGPLFQSVSDLRILIFTI